MPVLELAFEGQFFWVGISFLGVAPGEWARWLVWFFQMGMTNFFIWLSQRNFLGNNLFFGIWRGEWDMLVHFQLLMLVTKSKFCTLIWKYFGAFHTTMVSWVFETVLKCYLSLILLIHYVITVKTSQNYSLVYLKKPFFK